MPTKLEHTVVLVRSASGRAFGGYADQMWTSPDEGTDVESHSAFLFRLQAGFAQREKAGIREGDAYALHCHKATCGPIFDGSLFLCDTDDANGRHSAQVDDDYFNGFSDGKLVSGQEDEGNTKYFDCVWEVAEVVF